jgi:hypothetical protein
MISARKHSQARRGLVDEADDPDMIDYFNKDQQNLGNEEFDKDNAEDEEGPNPN